MKLSVMHVKILAGFLVGAGVALIGSYWVERQRTATAPPTAARTAELPATEPLTSTPPTFVAAPLPRRPPEQKIASREPAPKLPPYAEPDVLPIAAVTTPPSEAPMAPVAPALPEPVETPPLAIAPVETKPEERVPHSVTIPDGTVVRVRLSEPLSTKKNRVGDTFSGTLDQELVADGFVIAERGAKVEGRVTQSEEAGRTRGLAHLGLELTAIHTADGQLVRIQTAKFEQLGTTSKTDDWAKVGLGTAIGGAIGAAAGGGKGAAIGAAAGAAAGAGTVAATRGKPAEIAVETRISFKLEQPVMLTEKLP
jgi:hypothetical protein